jgi:hypothetical protein
VSPCALVRALQTNGLLQYYRRREEAIAEEVDLKQRTRQIHERDQASKRHDVQELVIAQELHFQLVVGPILPG